MRTPTLVHQRIERDKDGGVTQVVSMLQVTHADKLFGTAITFVAKNNLRVDLIRQCMNCGAEQRVNDQFVAAVANWSQGLVYIRDAFPHLTPGERETILDGTCASCFIEVFAEENEE